MIKRILTLMGLIVGLMASSSYAQTINAKGTSSAPVSVAGTATTVLDYKSGRKGWCLEPETVAIRCMPSDSSAAPAVTPTSSVGFLFPAGTLVCHNNMPDSALITNPQRIRLDCILATGAVATNVDTWEE